jgi:hypothetical protein
MKTVTCVVCKTELENLEWGDEDHVQPLDGLAFSTRGHYGSGIFDPISSPEYIEIVVCDLCVVKQIDLAHGNGADYIKATRNEKLAYATKCRNRRNEESKEK